MTADLRSAKVTAQAASYATFQPTSLLYHFKMVEYFANLVSSRLGRWVALGYSAHRLETQPLGIKVSDWPDRRVCGRLLTFPSCQYVSIIIR